MTSSKRLLTLHGPTSHAVRDEVLTAVESAMGRLGAQRVWVESQNPPDLTVMVEMGEPPSTR